MTGPGLAPAPTETPLLETPLLDAPLLQAYGLHRFFRRGTEEIAALRDVSLDVAAGETIAVMGPSGSGKSTLMSLLAGIDNPDAGWVSVAGIRLSHLPPARQARIRGRHIGVVTQASGLLDHLSLRANLALAASFRAPRRDTPDAEDLLDALGLTARAGARPSTLSGGETARANLAVALVGSPDVILADEPTAEISRTEELRVLQLLRELGTRTATVLVTHSAAVADAADRVVPLVDGRMA